MTPERWQEIKQLFNAALEHEPAGRLAFLAQASGNDESLRQEVASLLESLEQATDFIETPASDLAAELLARGQTGLVSGQMVGPFRISDVIAAGGMGEVYLADDTRLGRKVALKLLPPQFTVNADRVRRFELEARAASALNHPNIVTIHEIGETDDLHFIATEFVAGQTLREHMRKTRMTVGEVLDIGVQIASALQAAHDAGIVHRDIKPENIMLRHDGFVKVLDFGLAKLAAPLNSISETPETLLLTNPGVVMGTVAYMSPEQARALEVDARADIWSLGVVLYEMVAGRAPFEEPTSSDVIAAILKDEPESLATRADVPAELAQIIAKALRKDRTLRYQSAGELASDLKNLKEELGVTERLNRRFDPGKRSALSGKAGAEHDESGHQAVTTGPIPQPLTTVSVEYLVGNIQRHKILISVALLVLLGIGLTYIRFSRNKANSPTSDRSIAVLPLKPVDPANRDDLYEIGITDSLIRQLGSMKGIFVRPLSATRQYRDIAQDPIAAGKEQQVDYVLATNYQLTGGRISITAQLLNVASGQIEESYKTEKDLANNFAMQDAVAVEIGNWLLVQFATTTNRLARKRGTSNEEAYRLFLQGMYLANNRNLEDARRAIEALEKAVQLDPNYARAW
ncbi:MAG TPA: serine/threonine-protein kinase, partial [Pyrinomonadaceae bacterium]|nr:serine/threonine-protein kinase [Pyrinomonadaceae bacterium]